MADEGAIVTLDHTVYPNGPYCPRCHKSRPEAMLCGPARCLICWAKDTDRAARAARAALVAAPNPDFPAFTCVFHVFFLSLEETPEMLERLARNEAASVPAGPSRSRITGSTLAEITPIDRVAARVTPEGPS